MSIPGGAPYMALMPEINSWWIWSSEGVATWHLASTSWGEFAMLIASAIEEVSAQLLSIGTMFHGTTATSALLGMQPTLAWLAEMEAIATEHMTSNEAVAVAYEGTRAAMPTPVEIHSNRVAEATAEATNFMGVNTPLIVYLNAQYARMWVQAGTLMHAWDGDISSQTQNIPVPTSPPLTNIGGHLASLAGGFASEGALAGHAALTKEMFMVPEAEIDEGTAARKAAKMETPAQDVTQQTTNQGTMMGQQAGQQAFQTAGQSVMQGASSAGSNIQSLSQTLTQTAESIGNMASNAVSPGAANAGNVGHYGSTFSMLPQDLHNRVHGGAGLLGAGGVSLGGAHVNVQNTITASRLTASSTRGIDGLATAGNMRATLNAESNMNNNGMGGQRKPPVKKQVAEDRNIKRRFLDNMDAYGNVLDEDTENVVHEEEFAEEESVEAKAI